MNKENAKHYIPLLEALADGELQVQYSSGCWLDATVLDPSIEPERYRRKPKPREWFCADYQNGKMGRLRVSADEASRCSLEGEDFVVIKVREVLE